MRILRLLSAAVIMSLILSCGKGNEETLVDENEISVTGEALCKDCSAMYNVMRCEGKCPKCGSRNKTILGGTEFRIKEIGYAEEQIV